MSVIPGTATEPSAFLRQDTPGEHEDELQLQPFVQRIAAVLSNTNEAGAFVVSLEAAWGRGKTWCLHELKRQLGEKFNAYHQVEDFNPWLLNDERQIVQNLLVKIRRWVDASDTAALKEIASDVAKFAGALNKTSNLADHFGVGFSIGQVLGGVAKLPSKDTVDLDALKSKVVKELKTAKKRLFIFIDDLDRLTSDEFVSTIRAIKAVADFPHITYVLAFDGEVAGQQLRSAGIERGSEYLDKIIQLRAPLPPITREQKRVLFDKAISLLPTYARNQFEVHQTKSRLSEVFHDGLCNLLRSPRDVKRVMNRITLLPPELFQDVNLADLIALSAIDITDTSMYSELCKQYEVFVSDEIPNESDTDRYKRLANSNDSSEEVVRTYRRELLDKFAKPTTRKLLWTLFPNLVSKHYTPNSPNSLRLGHVSHTRNLYAALRFSLSDEYAPIDVCRRLINAKAVDFAAVLHDLQKSYGLSKLLASLSDVLPYEAPDERSHIWEALTSTIRNDTIARESSRTRFAKTHAFDLVNLMYETERLARADERGHLRPFSFRDWCLTSLSDTKYTMFWACTLEVAIDRHDKPGSANGKQGWTSQDEEKWNDEQLTSLLSAASEWITSGKFLYEPESGYLLRQIAKHQPNICTPLVQNLCASTSLFDLLAYRVVYAYEHATSETESYYLNFHVENPLRKTNPELVEMARLRLKKIDLPRHLRLSCMAIAGDEAVLIEASDYSSPI